MGKFSFRDVLERMGLTVSNTPVTTGGTVVDDYSSEQQPSRGFSRRDGKVVDFPQGNGEASTIHEAVIYLLRSCDDCRDVIDDMLAGRSVLLNLEELKPQQSQRVIDMLSGATYAEDAVIRKIAVNTYYLAPRGVKITNSAGIEGKTGARASYEKPSYEQGYGPEY